MENLSEGKPSWSLLPSGNKQRLWERGGLARRKKRKESGSIGVTTVVLRFRRDNGKGTKGEDAAGDTDDHELSARS